MSISWRRNKTRKMFAREY